MKFTKLLTLLVIGLLLGYFMVFFLPTLLFAWLRRYVQPADPEPYQCTYNGAQDVPYPAEDEWIDRVEKWITK